MEHTHKKKIKSCGGRGGLVCGQSLVADLCGLHPSTPLSPMNFLQCVAVAAYLFLVPLGEILSYCIASNTNFDCNQSLSWIAPEPWILADGIVRLGTLVLMFALLVCLPRICVPDDHEDPNKMNWPVVIVAVLYLLQQGTWLFVATLFTIPKMHFPCTNSGIVVMLLLTLVMNWCIVLGGIAYCCTCGRRKRAPVTPVHVYVKPPPVAFDHV